MRSRSPSRSRSLSLGVRIMVCLGLAAATLAVQHFHVTDHEVVAPITASGQRGAVVATDDFTIEVTDVELADTITDTGRFEAEPVEANGAWLVVWARVTATHTTIRSVGAELEMGDGTVYSASPWFLSAFGTDPFRTALPTRGAFAFEIPVDRVDSPALVVTNLNSSGSRLAAQASVDFELDGDAVRDERADIDLDPPETQMGEDSDAPA